MNYPDGAADDVIDHENPFGFEALPHLFLMRHVYSAGHLDYNFDSSFFGDNSNGF
jgi:hypothetical protein